MLGGRLSELSVSLLEPGQSRGLSVFAPARRIFLYDSARMTVATVLRCNYLLCSLFTSVGAVNTFPLPGLGTMERWSGNFKGGAEILRCAWESGDLLVSYILLYSPGHLHAQRDIGPRVLHKNILPF